MEWKTTQIKIICRLQTNKLTEFQSIWRKVTHKKVEIKTQHLYPTAKSTWP